MTAEAEQSDSDQYRSVHGENALYSARLQPGRFSGIVTELQQFFRRPLPNVVSYIYVCVGTQLHCFLCESLRAHSHRTRSTLQQVHANYRTHCSKRVCTQICAQICLRVLCERGLTLHLFSAVVSMDTASVFAATGCAGHLLNLSAFMLNLHSFSYPLATHTENLLHLSVVDLESQLNDIFEV